MKVLFLALALLATSFAMPVAEEKQEKDKNAAAIEATSASSLEKQTESKPQNDAKAEKPEIKKEVSEKKVNEKSLENDEQKHEVLESSEDKHAVAENKNEIKELNPPKVPDVTKDVEKSIPVPKPEMQNEESKTENHVPEQNQKSEEPELKSVPKEESAATVTEVANKVEAKSNKPEEAIDILHAIKTPAAVADDFVDAAAILPSSFNEKKFEQDIKKEDTKNSGEVKTEESTKPKLENKKDEVSASHSESSTAVDDSLRVVRDTVDDKEKASTDGPKVASKSNEVAKVGEVFKEVQPANKIDVDKKSTEDKKLGFQEKASEPEKPVVEIKKDEVKPVKVEEVKAKSAEAEVSKESEKPKSEAVTDKPGKEDIKPKLEEKPASEAPKESSEESDESGEKKDDSKEKNSSEEVTGSKNEEKPSKP